MQFARKRCDLMRRKIREDPFGDHQRVFGSRPVASENLTSRQAVEEVDSDALETTNGLVLGELGVL